MGISCRKERSPGLEQLAFATAGPSSPWPIPPMEKSLPPAVETGIGYFYGTNHAPVIVIDTISNTDLLLHEFSHILLGIGHLTTEGTNFNAQYSETRAEVNEGQTELATYSSQSCVTSQFELRAPVPLMDGQNFTIPWP